LTQGNDPAALIREVRARLGLTQEKFAAKLGVTLPTINRWENGRTKPSPLAIRNLRDLVASMGNDGNDLAARFSNV
jgi:DNA-binding transcriptional regulator YiaG